MPLLKEKKNEEWPPRVHLSEDLVQPKKFKKKKKKQKKQKDKIVYIH